MSIIELELLKKFYVLMLAKQCGSVDGNGDPVYFKDGRGSGTISGALKLAVDVGLIDKARIIE